MSAEHQATEKVGKRLAELIDGRKNLDAIKELYADNAKHVEVMGGPGCDRICEGKANLLEKAEQFHKSITIHGHTVGKPITNGEQFILPMSLDSTFNDGPMAGTRMNMEETALYTVKGGKITEAKFFYGGCGMEEK
jgi:ketosteroid isomerase-like protein